MKGCHVSDTHITRDHRRYCTVTQTFEATGGAHLLQTSLPFGPVCAGFQAGRIDLRRLAPVRQSPGGYRLSMGEGDSVMPVVKVGQITNARSTSS